MQTQIEANQSTIATANTKQASLVQTWIFLRIVTLIAASLIAWGHGLQSLLPSFNLPDIIAWITTPWNRWDVEYYVQIVTLGYRTDNGTAQFHPLLSWLATPIYWLIGEPVLALLIISSSASFLLLLVFKQLAALDNNPNQTYQATMLLFTAPVGLILFAPYTEALFLLWSALCLLWMRQKRWWLAGLAGGLATLTRQQGLFLLIPLAWELWEHLGRGRGGWTAIRRNIWSICALGLIPCGLVIWLVYRAVVLDDFRFNPEHPQSLIYSLLISSSSSKVVPNQAFLLPPHALWLAIEALINTPVPTTFIDLILGAGFVVLVVKTWKHMRTSYQLYALATTLISFAYYTGPFYPYMGLPRHLLLGLPVFIVLGAILDKRRYTIIALSGVCVSFALLVMYVFETWVP
jgi:hypothetical protein